MVELRDPLERQIAWNVALALEDMPRDKLAAALGISKRVLACRLSRYRCRLCLPRLGDLVRLAVAADMRIDKLIGAEELAGMVVEEEI